MKYTLKNGRSIVIPDKEIDKLVSSLEISIEDAIDLWLDDNNIETNEIAEELDEKASKVKIERDIVQVSTKKERKKPEIKISSEKQQLFNEILTNLTEIYGENVKILNENKLISIKIGNLNFKVDIIQQRPPKN